MEQGLISIVIPKLSPRDDGLTLTEDSLARTTYPKKEFIVVPDSEKRNANWARNQGWRQAKGEFLLFSDCDCDWVSDALDMFVRALARDPNARYAYCAFLWGDQERGMGPFPGRAVIQMSRFSTMSLFRVEGFPGFDESLQRLQDWDLYLTLLMRDGRLGTCIPRVLFKTAAREGISHGGDHAISWDKAQEIVKKKHGLSESENAAVLLNR